MKRVVELTTGSVVEVRDALFPTGLSDISDHAFLTDYLTLGIFSFARPTDSPDVE